MNFASGGEVKKQEGGISNDHPVESMHPDQNIILHSIKGRAADYLNSLRPQKYQPKLVFDDEPDTTTQKKAYKRALHIAAHPTSVLDKVRKGTLEPEHIKHLNALYPELNNALQKKLTEKITEAQLKGEKPSFKVRQSLSLLMGAALSGEMTPQNIMAAQATFQSKQNQPQQAGDSGATKSKGSALTKASQSLLTADQAAASRQQKQ